MAKFFGFCVVVLAALSLVHAVPIPQINAPAVICVLPPQRGHCRALLPRWRYDPSTRRCSEFKFGGCDGNGNNFPSEKDCMNVCAGI